MAGVRTAVERRKASASRWTRGHARSAYGWQHPMRGEAPRDSRAFSALRLPLFFWRQKLGGFGRQNSDAGASRERDGSRHPPPRSGGGGPLELAKRANRGGGGAGLEASLSSQKSLFAKRSERTCSDVTRTLAAR